jgi:hypothetical protein
MESEEIRESRNIRVLSYKEFPQSEWSSERKSFFMLRIMKIIKLTFRRSSEKLKLHSSAEKKSKLFINRYNQIASRAKRFPLFVESKECTVSITLLQLFPILPPGTVNTHRFSHRKSREKNYSWDAFSIEGGEMVFGRLEI